MVEMGYIKAHNANVLHWKIFKNLSNIDVCLTNHINDMFQSQLRFMLKHQTFMLHDEHL